MRGGLVSLAFGGAAAVLAAVVGIVVGVRALGGGSSPAAAASTVPKGALVADQGMHAPGTDALRKLGCSHALVIDMARLLGGPGKVRDGEPRYMVTCEVADATHAPACERVADTYFGAIGGTAAGNVGVRVATADPPKSRCSRLYAPSGADLGPFPTATE